jgi:hypothetical protein
MVEAGWNLILYYRLLPKSETDNLKALSKANRKIQIGKLMRDNPEFNRRLTKAFSLMRKKFFEENNIGESNVLSIKKDAIFVLDKVCKHRKFGNVEFATKNRYTSFHLFGNVEMYYQSSTDTLHIKGINDDTLELHRNYMIYVLKMLFRSLESDNRKVFVNTVKEFTKFYKERKLPLGYYREFNPQSVFTITEKLNILSSYRVAFPDVGEDLRDTIDISYNYMNYILPIIQRFYFTF